MYSFHHRDRACPFSSHISISIGNLFQLYSIGRCCVCWSNTDSQSSYCLSLFLGSASLIPDLNPHLLRIFEIGVHHMYVCMYVCVCVCMCVLWKSIIVLVKFMPPSLPHVLSCGAAYAASKQDIQPVVILMEDLLATGYFIFLLQSG